MASLLAFYGVDVALAAGGTVLVILSSLVWRAEANTRDALREKSYDGDTRAPLEQMYLDSHSFRGLYIKVHDVLNQPPLMVAEIAAVPTIGILVGTFYVFHTDFLLPFVVAVFVLGQVWYFGDALESALVISYAARSTLRRSDRDSVSRYRELVRLGKFYLMALGICLVVPSLLDAAGLLAYIERPWGIMVVAAAVGLAFSAGWRRTLSANQPVLG